jgi:hypothetical protein
MPVISRDNGEMEVAGIESATCRMAKPTHRMSLTAGPLYH